MQNLSLRGIGGRDEKDAALALALLQGRNLSLTQLAMLAIEVLEDSYPLIGSRELPIAVCRRVLDLGVAELKKQYETIPFSELAERVLQSKSQVRERSIAEVRQVFARIAKCDGVFFSALVRQITPEDCQKLIYKAYDTLSMRHKALRILHCAFAYALKFRWCSFNPTDQVELPKMIEHHIPVLTIRQVYVLLKTLLTKEHIICAPAVGLMLWAGIRPYELMRLKWGNLNFEDKVVTVPAEHSKTGGARHITIYPVLQHWLRVVNPMYVRDVSIVPRGWMKRWRLLRQAAGLNPWHEDTLRHTFASYHAKHFGDFNLLQMEMGHSSSSLLRTRYLSMQGVTRKGAETFWEDIVDKVTAASESLNA